MMSAGVEAVTDCGGYLGVSLQPHNVCHVTQNTRKMEFCSIMDGMKKICQKLVSALLFLIHSLYFEQFGDIYS